MGSLESSGMRVKSPRFPSRERARTACALASGLAGILVFPLSGGAVQTGGFRPSGPVEPAVKSRPLVYVSDQTSNRVVIFERDGKELGTLSTGLNYPQGLFVDDKHNVWVANRGAGNVLAFARGATTPSFTLVDTGNQPEDVTVCPDGTVYVANILAGSAGGSIEVYPRGSSQPSRSLTYNGDNAFYVTCDRAGNVFASVLLGTGGTVVEFPGGQQSGATMIPIFTDGNPGPIKPDNAGNLLVGDPTGSVTEYTEAGAPTGVQIEPKGGWGDFVPDRRGNLILGVSGAPLGAQALDFPSGAHRRNYRSSYLSQPSGVAYDPGQAGI